MASATHAIKGQAFYLRTRQISRYETTMSFYSRFILAPLINCACGCKLIGEKRALIVPQARGVVLELGAGPGHNLQYYDPQLVTKLIAVEPEAAFEPAFRKAARQTSIEIDFRLETAEQLTLPPQSVDTILATFVLCTIPDGVAALKAAKRALRPDGRLIFCEHGLAPEPKVARTQRRLDPVWRAIFGGCHLSRPVPTIIESAGFRLEALDAGYMEGSPRFASYLYQGAAAPV
jgi:SAM-dependent methyltransferase